jgi:inhibitor of cysteine peptidase
MRRVLVALVALLPLLLFGCLPQVVGEWSDSFTVSLEGNPTTGYEWTYSMSRDGVVEEVSSEYVSSATDPSRPQPGTGGTYTFVFEGVRAGDVTLTFVYDRSWSTSGPPQTEVYKLRVNDAGQIAQLG